MPDNKIQIKEILMTMAIALSYGLLLWLALISIPLISPPSWFTALFSIKSQAVMSWIKIRHTAIVCLVAIPLGFATLKILRKHAFIGGLVVGCLVATYSEIYNCITFIRFELVPNISGYLKFRMHDTVIPLWVPLTDFIIIAGALPLTVWSIKRIKAMHNTYKALACQETNDS